MRVVGVLGLETCLWPQGGHPPTPILLLNPEQASRASVDVAHMCVHAVYVHACWMCMYAAKPTHPCLQ